MAIQTFLQQMTPALYQRLKTALELGKWPDGQLMVAEQKEALLLALLIYEQQLPEAQRTGYMPDSCGRHEKPAAEPITWRES